MHPIGSGEREPLSTIKSARILESPKLPEKWACIPRTWPGSSANISMKARENSFDEFEWTARLERSCLRTCRSKRSQSVQDSRTKLISAASSGEYTVSRLWSIAICPSGSVRLPFNCPVGQKGQEIGHNRRVTRDQIIPRLDGIEERKRLSVLDQSGEMMKVFSQSEIARVADLAALSRTRVIAENALILLPSNLAEAVLGEFEQEPYISRA